MSSAVSQSTSTSLPRLGGTRFTFQQIFAHARFDVPPRVMDELVTVSSLHAKMQAVERTAVIVVGCDADDLAILHVQIQLTADAAIGAGGADEFDPPARVDGHLVVERARRAVGHARAARLAAGGQHGRVVARHDASLVAAKGLRPDETSLHFGAGAHTAQALDTFVAIHPAQRDSGRCPRGSADASPSRRQHPHRIPSRSGSVRCLRPCRTFRSRVCSPRRSNWKATCAGWRVGNG